MSKYGAFSGRYFPVFGLNTGKYRPEKTPYLDTFHALYSQTIDDVYENLDDYNPRKKRRVLIVFDDMIADMESNEKLSLIVIELFLRGRKLNILLVLISQSYLKVPKSIRLNATRYFILKVSNKRELQQIASNHSCDIDFKDFMKLKNHIHF